MSQLDSSSAKRRPLPGQKPKTNIYTLMLIFALLLMLVGCLFMYLEYQLLTT